MIILELILIGADEKGIIYILSEDENIVFITLPIFSTP